MARVKFKRGNFRHTREKFRAPDRFRQRVLRKASGFHDVRGRRQWRGSCLLALTSIDVFRAALISIVLTMTLGQNVALLCRVWCHPQQSVNSACEHQVQTTSPSVTANESCSGVAAELALFVREDGRQTASASDSQQSVAVARFLLVRPPSFSARALESSQAATVEGPPLVLALRI